MGGAGGPRTAAALVLVVALMTSCGGGRAAPTQAAGPSPVSRLRAVAAECRKLEPRDAICQLREAEGSLDPELVASAHPAALRVLDRHAQAVCDAIAAVDPEVLGRLLPTGVADEPEYEGKSLGCASTGAILLVGVDSTRPIEPCDSPYPGKSCEDRGDGSQFADDSGDGAWGVHHVFASGGVMSVQLGEHGSRKARDLPAALDRIHRRVVELFELGQP